MKKILFFALTTAISSFLSISLPELTEEAILDRLIAVPKTFQVSMLKFTKMYSRFALKNDGHRVRY